MKFALLGIDPESLALVRAVADSRDGELVAIFAVSEEVDELRRLCPGATWHDEWEGLLHETAAEAVIVARGALPETRAEQLRKLTQATIPLLLVHPACESIIGYELDMIRRDSACLILPYHPGVLHPAIHQIRELARRGAESAIGHVQQLVFDRVLPQPNRREVLDQLARDALLVRRVLGDVTKVSAMGAEQDFSNLSVHMSTRSQTLARWSVNAAGARLEGRLVLIGSSGQATLMMPADERSWSLEVTGLGRVPLADFHGPSTALESFRTAATGPGEGPNWDDACRAVEMAEAVEQSLRRGRTIDLHNIDHTEEDTFKSLMAVGGCGLLTVAMFVVLLVAIVEGLQLPFRNHPWWRRWPVCLLILLSIFLLLQLFKFAFPATNNVERN